MHTFGTQDDRAGGVADRRRMVKEQLRGRGIRDPAVLEVMGRVPREDFVLPEDRERAYDDRPLGIGRGATISQPFIVALMTEALAPGPEERVLEIGTGSGYQAAVLAELAAEVFSVEIDPQLAERARRRLETAGYENVHLRRGDGRRGWPEAAPFDGILLSAAPVRLPPALLRQLADGGRLVAPVGGHDQVLELWSHGEDGLQRRTLTAVRFVPLLGEDDDAG